MISPSVIFLRVILTSAASGGKLFDRSADTADMLHPSLTPPPCLPPPFHVYEYSGIARCSDKEKEAQSRVSASDERAVISEKSKK